MYIIDIILYTQIISLYIAALSRHTTQNTLSKKKWEIVGNPWKSNKSPWLLSQLSPKYESSGIPKNRQQDIGNLGPGAAGVTKLLDGEPERLVIDSSGL